MMTEIVSLNLYLISYKRKKNLFVEGIQRLKEKAKKKKGRGFGADTVAISHREPIDYESVRDDNEEEPGPQRCIHFY